MGILRIQRYTNRHCSLSVCRDVPCPFLWWQMAIIQRPAWHSAMSIQDNFSIYVQGWCMTFQFVTLFPELCFYWITDRTYYAVFCLVVHRPWAGIYWSCNRWYYMFYVFTDSPLPTWLHIRYCIRIYTPYMDDLSDVVAMHTTLTYKSTRTLSIIGALLYLYFT